MIAMIENRFVPTRKRIRPIPFVQGCSSNVRSNQVVLMEWEEYLPVLYFYLIQQNRVILH